MKLKKLKIYLSYILNELNNSGSTQLETLSTTEYRKNPYESLIDGLNSNEDDLTEIEELLLLSVRRSKPQQQN